MNENNFSDSLLSKSQIISDKIYFPGFNSPNFKEYKNLGGYYLKITYENKELSILAKDIELLQQNQYEMKMNLNYFYSKNDIFKKYYDIEQIFKMIIDLINENNYKFNKNEENLDFYLIIKETPTPKDEFSFLLFDEAEIDPNDENNSINEIILKLFNKNNNNNDNNNDKKDNSNNEYINSLLNEITKLQNQIYDITNENTNIKYDLLKLKENDFNMNNLKEENIKIKNELIKLKEENQIIPSLKDEIFEYKNIIMKLKEENGEINNLKLENIRIRNELLKLKEENKIINEIKEENIKYKNELNNLSKLNSNSTTPKNEKIKNIKINLNCSECPLIPEIKLDNFGIPNIESKCPNGHKEKDFNLINYLKKSKNFCKDNYKCKCNQNIFNKNDLYYCKGCNSFICNKCWTEHNSNYPKHKLIIHQLINYNCIEHKREFTSYCKDCGNNICNECLKDHKGHSIEELDLMILSDDEFNSLLKKKENIINHLRNIQNSLDSYKNDWSNQMEILKNYYEIEINLFEEIVNQYSNCKNNYHNIKNLRNIHKFPFDNVLLSQNEETVFVKTEIILNILNKIRNQKINTTTPKPPTKTEDQKSNNNFSNIKLIKELKLEKCGESICYLKKYNLIAIGGKNKIELFNMDFNYLNAYKSLDGVVSYLSELKDGKLLAVLNNNKIEILKIEYNKSLELFQKIETKLEDYNFVGIELSNKDIICGGRKYLSVISLSAFNIYWCRDNIDLNGFISNLVELDSYTFLIGQCERKNISIYSSSNYQKIKEINIPVYGNNYSISKLSDDFVAIGGQHLNYAFVFIYSIDRREICNYYKNEMTKCCNTLSKINDDSFIISLKNREDKFDLSLFKYKKDSREIAVKQIGFYKDAMSNNIESMVSFNGYVLTSDTNGNLKIWKIE